jgi:hypothetical protein
MTPDDRAGDQTALFPLESSEKTTEQTTAGGVRILSEVEKAWLAGVIDGEGSIFICKVTPKKFRYRRGFFYRPELSVANSNPALLARVQEVIGKGYFGRDKEKKQNPSWNDKWQYRGSGQVLRGILPQILPYLTAKREIAEAMLRYLSFIDEDPIDGPKQPPPGYDETLDSLYVALKVLNAKGRTASLIPGDANLAPWGPKHRGRGGRATECRMLSEVEKAWLAGVIDGEGSIFLSKVTSRRTRRGYFYLPTIGVSNTNRIFLTKVANTIGEGTVCFAKKGDAKTKPRWVYIAASGVLRAIPPQILPYLIVKKDRVVLMSQFLEFLDNNPIYGKGDGVPPGYYARLDSLYLAMKLNQKGKPVGRLVIISDFLD